MPNETFGTNRENFSSCKDELENKNIEADTAYRKHQAKSSLLLNQRMPQRVVILPSQTAIKRIPGSRSPSVAI